MPTQQSKITSRMASLFNREWLAWFNDLGKLVGSKLDTITGASGKIPVINSDGELEDSGLTAARVVSGPSVSVVGNLVVFDNITGTLVADSGRSLTTLLSLDELTDVTISSAERGDILIRGASGWVNIHHGTSGQMLTTGGHGADPSWTTPMAPGGSDTHVQFNDGGALGGESTFTYQKTTNTFTVAGLVLLKADPSYEPSLWVSASGRLAYGFSTGTPSYSFSFVGTSGMSVGVERNTSSDAGQELTIDAGGAKSGATNAAGGTLRLKGGTATGSGSSVVEIWTATAGASGTADRATTAKVMIDGSGNVNIPTGATFQINGSAHTHTTLGDVTTEDITLSTAYQPSLNFYDSNPSGPADQHKAKILYDSGVEIDNIGGWVMQDISDAGAFVANRITIWKDGSVHFGGITRPDAAGGIHISSGKLEVAGYNIETNKQLVSTVVTGAAIAVSNSVVCTNLNSDMCDGYHLSDLVTGWTPDGDTWVYVSASSFKVAGKNVTARFPVGTKLKWTQTSAKYAYVKSSAFSTDTTITIAGEDYTVANATITSPCYSYVDNPQGFPQWFTFVPTLTGVSSQPTTPNVKFTVSGGVCRMYNGIPGGYAVSNANTLTVSLPFTVKTGYINWTSGLAVDNGNIEWVDCVARPEAGTTYATIFSNKSDTGWTTSGNKAWLGDIVFAIG